MRVSASTLAFVSQLLLPALAADTAAWKSRNIYFVLTDRIARSADDTGGGACGDLSGYCGGTFKGLESKLDYIAGMGFDAIWITPVVASKDPLTPTGTTRSLHDY
jgi:alpha-amylase